ncbi:MAG: VOC family protein [Chitinophagaceae bacterium]|nr:MAG: VOC family protein [Chitinophagaceae bacterium]
MQKITPFLWFNDNAEEAVALYTGLFGGTVTQTERYGPHGPGPEGSVMTMAFELFGQKYIALNGGPHYQFTEAVSFVVNCETQEEIDRYWEALLADGGKASRCGWLKDRFGLSWQIVPVQLPQLLKAGDAAAKGRVMAAMMNMVKMDIAALEAAAAAR